MSVSVSLLLCGSGSSVVASLDRGRLFCCCLKPNKAARSNRMVEGDKVAQRRARSK